MQAVAKFAVSRKHLTKDSLKLTLLFQIKITIPHREFDLATWGDRETESTQFLVVGLNSFVDQQLQQLIPRVRDVKLPGKFQKPSATLLIVAVLPLWQNTLFEYIVTPGGKLALKNL